MLRNFTPSHLFSKSAIIAYVCAFTLHPASGGVNDALWPYGSCEDFRLVQCSTTTDSYPVKRTAVQRSTFGHVGKRPVFSPFKRAVDKYAPFAEVAGCDDGTIFKQTTIAERAVFERFAFVNFTICHTSTPTPFLPHE